MTKIGRHSNFITISLILLLAVTIQPSFARVRCYECLVQGDENCQYPTPECSATEFCYKAEGMLNSPSGPTRLMKKGCSIGNQETGCVESNLTVFGGARSIKGIWCICDTELCNSASNFFQFSKQKIGSAFLFAVLFNFILFFYSWIS